MQEEINLQLPPCGISAWKKDQLFKNSGQAYGKKSW